MTVAFEKPGSLPRPGALGRGLRLALGILFLYFFLGNLTSFEGYLALREGWDVPGGTWWIAAALGFYFLNDIVGMGFGRAWRWWPQLIFALLALAAATLDLWVYGSLWAPPLGFLVFLLVVYVFAHVGVSHLVAAIFATPG